MHFISQVACSHMFCWSAHIPTFIKKLSKGDAFIMLYYYCNVDIEICKNHMKSRRYTIRTRLTTDSGRRLRTVPVGILKVCAIQAVEIFYLGLFTLSNFPRADSRTIILKSRSHNIGDGSKSRHGYDTIV